MHKWFRLSIYAKCGSLGIFTCNLSNCVLMPPYVIRCFLMEVGNGLAYLGA
jgi:hypothetical protein